MVSVAEAQAASQKQDGKPVHVVSHNSNMLQHLVTEAVKKVLADQENVADTEKVSQNIVSQVVEGLKPTLASGSAVAMRGAVGNVIGKHIAIPTPITKPVACVYNPTPIAELKKRHIPVISYMPTRESRVAVKRKTASPERSKPWLNLLQESESSHPAEITYKPTAIVSPTGQEAVQSYVPTIKPDSPLSSSYDDSNSNDYQAKFKEEYYPRSKKRREEYVPKKIKAPLKPTQELDETTTTTTTMDQFGSEFDMIDEIYTGGCTSSALGQTKALHSEDSQDYSLDIEPKFSDDESSSEDVSKDENGTKEKEAEQIKDIGAREGNVERARGIDAANEETSNKDEKIRKNHYEMRTEDAKSGDRRKEGRANDAGKSSERREDATKDNEEKGRRRSHSKSKDRDRKDCHGSESRDKERSRHKSDAKARHRSSSSKDKEKKRSSHDKSISHRNKERSDSRRDKRESSKKDRDDRHKSSRHDKQKSGSSKHASSAKRHSGSSRRSSNSSRKSVKHKESGSERNYSSDRSSLSDGVHSFAYEAADEILELSDSDHDVQEECLRIFQVDKYIDQDILEKTKGIVIKLIRN